MSNVNEGTTNNPNPSQSSPAAQQPVAAGSGSILNKANDLVAQAGAGLSDIGERIARGLPQDGMLGNASKILSEKVRDGGAYLQERQFGGVNDDLAGVVRKNVLPTVLIALGIGWIFGRHARR